MAKRGGTGASSVGVTSTYGTCICTYDVSVPTNTLCIVHRTQGEMPSNLIDSPVLQAYVLALQSPSRSIDSLLDRSID